MTVLKQSILRPIPLLKESHLKEKVMNSKFDAITIESGLGGLAAAARFAEYCKV
jgi:precorrin isomerase